MILRLAANLDAEIFSEVLSNIVLIGASTRFLGFPERFSSELKDALRKEGKVKEAEKAVVAYHLEEVVWKGAAHFATTKIFDELSLSKGAYDDGGSSLISKSCFSWDLKS